jgi:hypothetical protein
VANNIESIEIFPGENGGHRVVHNFKRQPGKKEGSMGGSVYMERRTGDEESSKRLYKRWLLRTPTASRVISIAL